MTVILAPGTTGQNVYDLIDHDSTGVLATPQIIIPGNGFYTLSVLGYMIFDSAPTAGEFVTYQVRYDGLNANTIWTWYTYVGMSLVQPVAFARSGVQFAAGEEATVWVTNGTSVGLTVDSPFAAPNQHVKFDISRV